MLTQAEADRLMAMNKKRLKREQYEFPVASEGLTIPIVSMDETESFLLDVSRGRIRLTKCTYQERYQGIIVLVRLDVDGPPHTNPDVPEVPLPYLAEYNDATVPCPHLHLYVENFMDKWTIPAPTDKFPRTDDLYATFDDFLRYCYIIEAPIIQKGLFV
jgi:hypothetical protein